MLLIDICGSFTFICLSETPGYGRNFKCKGYIFLSPSTHYSPSPFVVIAVYFLLKKLKLCDLCEEFIYKNNKKNKSVGVVRNAIRWSPGNMNLLLPPDISISKCARLFRWPWHTLVREHGCRRGGFAAVFKDKMGQRDGSVDGGVCAAVLAWWIYYVAHYNIKWWIPPHVHLPSPPLNWNQRKKEGESSLWLGTRWDGY